VKAVGQLFFACLVAFLLYSANIFSLSFYLIPFTFLLLMAGWWMGFFVAGLILHYGKRLQNFAWTLAWAFAPLSCVYYPLSALPDWVQYLARMLPMTYVFEGMRSVLLHGTMDYKNFVFAFGINVLYLLLAGWYLRHGFKKVLNQGLVKLM
ncbi:MAG TPA: ABC transporter permease, partial [Patescibacteria group bacterium]|nr:ABC transporter permease [Patescibacteria group bacterium]